MELPIRYSCQSPSAHDSSARLRSGHQIALVFEENQCLRDRLSGLVEIAARGEYRCQLHEGVRAIVDEVDRFQDPESLAQEGFRSLEITTASQDGRLCPSPFDLRERVFGCARLAADLDQGVGFLIPTLRAQRLGKCCGMCRQEGALAELQ